MLIWDSFQLDKTMPDAETMGPEFYAPSVNTRYDYEFTMPAKYATPHRIVNVNESIEIKLLQ